MLLDKVLFLNGGFSSWKYSFRPLRPFVNDFFFQNCLIFCKLRARKIWQHQNFGLWWGQVWFWNEFFNIHVIYNPFTVLMAKSFLEQSKNHQKYFYIFFFFVHPVYRSISTSYFPKKQIGFSCSSQCVVR